MAGLLGLTGCGADSAGSKQAIQQHLEQKYGDIDYTIYSYSPAGFSQGYYQLIGCLPGGTYSSDSFTATYYPAADGKPGYYLDSYYGLANRDQFEDMIKPVAAQYFKDFRVYTTYKNFPDDVTLDDSIESVIQSGKFARNNVSVFVPASEFDNSGIFANTTFQKVSDEFAKAWTKQCNHSTVVVDAVGADTYAKLADRDYTDTLSNSPDFNSLIIGSYLSPASSIDKQFDPAEE
jgi:hypothetical protein